MHRIQPNNLFSLKIIFLNFRSRKNLFYVNCSHHTLSKICDLNINNFEIAMIEQDLIKFIDLILFWCPYPLCTRGHVTSQPTQPPYCVILVQKMGPQFRQTVFRSSSSNHQFSAHKGPNHETYNSHSSQSVYVNAANVFCTEVMNGINNYKVIISTGGVLRSIFKRLHLITIILVPSQDSSSVVTIVFLC